MITFQTCGVCDNVYSLMREHCPVCSARRKFIASHSYEPYCIQVTATSTETGRELVRAFRTDCAFRFITVRGSNRHAIQQTGAQTATIRPTVK